MYMYIYIYIYICIYTNTHLEASLRERRTPCGVEVLHLKCWMSRTKHPM